MNDPGYQQKWQSGGGYYPYVQNDVDPFAWQGSRVLAALSAVLGLGLAGVLTWQGLGLRSRLDGVGGLAEIWNVGLFAVAGILFVGAVLVFARRVVGAFIVSGGALIALAGLLLAPLIVPEVTQLMAGLWSSDVVAVRRFGYGDYVKALFEPGNELAVRQLVGVVLAVLVMGVAMLRPSRDWLGRRHKDDYSAWS